MSWPWQFGLWICILTLYLFSKAFSKEWRGTPPPQAIHRCRPPSPCKKNLLFYHLIFIKELLVFWELCYQCTMRKYIVVYCYTVLYCSMFTIDRTPLMKAETYQNIKNIKDIKAQHDSRCEKFWCQFSYISYPLY